MTWCCDADDDNSSGVDDDDDDDCVSGVYVDTMTLALVLMKMIMVAGL